MLVAPVAIADGDPDRGRRLFLQCAACHAAGPDRQTKLGPALQGVVGRRAGGADGFPYSEALASAAFDWTPERLDAWLARPADVVPGTTMAFVGVASAKDRVDLVAYLRTLGAGHAGAR